jgi:hypothetical protein
MMRCISAKAWCSEALVSRIGGFWLGLYDRCLSGVRCSRCLDGRMVQYIRFVHLYADLIAHTCWEPL